MSNSTENYSQWQPPEGGGPPLGAGEKLWLYGKCALAGGAEVGNWALHTANYSLVNTVGNDVFLVDVLGLPGGSMLQDLTLNMLINGTLGAAAVATPIFLFSALLEHHEEIFEDPKGFFSKGLNILVTIFLAVLYLIVIATEFMALSLRVVSENAPSAIPDMGGDPTGFWPMMMMSLALIAVNAGFGLATAHIFKAASRALKGG